MKNFIVCAGLLVAVLAVVKSKRPIDIPTVVIEAGAADVVPDTTALPDVALPFIPTEDPISTPPKQHAAPTAPVQVCDPRTGNCEPGKSCGTSSRPTYTSNRGGLLRRFLFRR